MNLHLTWDLFFIAFFAVIITYSCILGKNCTLKIIISSYVAILTADGLGNLVSTYLIGSDPLLNIFVPTSNSQIIILTKIIIFVCTIIILVTRGAFDVFLIKEQSIVIDVLMTVTFAVLSAGLIISTILIYASGISLVSGSFQLENSVIYDIYRDSQMSRLLINHYSAWFSLPAIVFVLTSFMFPDGNSSE